MEEVVDLCHTWCTRGRQCTAWKVHGVAVHHVRPCEEPRAALLHLHLELARRPARVTDAHVKVGALRLAG